MKILQISTLVLAIVVVSTLATKDEDDAWEAFKKKHGRNHKDASEEAKRKEIFLQVHRRIDEHNKSDKPWRMGHNELSDMTPEEKKQLTGRKVVQEREAVLYDPSNEVLNRQLPISLDYRNDPCVGPVKNQGSCGSCWAFSSTVPLEFQLCKANGAYTSLSEQQLVNCACSGCKGGDYYPAWKYLNSTSTGSETSTTLSYQAKTSRCKAFSSGLIKPVTWVRLPIDVPTIMNSLNLYGPLAVAMHVTASFQNYLSGVYDGTDCSSDYYSLNHAMALVGFGTDPTTGLDYWTVRNSWGSNWGAKGYVLVRRGVNRCGVETDVGYVESNLAF